MHPLHLSMRNFGTHEETEFSFEDFSSALVIAKIKGNDRFSNAGGKSTIFSAIEYALFNEIQFSSLEKVIRDGCEACRVEFQFLSSLDKSTYKIIRSNSRKTGTDVRLFKLSPNDNWEDFSQRRVSDTEKEIVKIVGFNYKSFCASVAFVQPGSENNIQKDFGNLPALTPEKRKSVLREVLQLNVYGSYEKSAKTKYAKLSADLDIKKITMSNLGEPESLINELDTKSIKIKSELKNNNDFLETLREKITNKKSEHKILLDKSFTTKTFLLKQTEAYNICRIQVDKHIKSVDDLRAKIKNLPIEANELKAKIDSNKLLLSELNSQSINLDKHANDLLNIDNDISMAKAIVDLKGMEAKKLNCSLPSEDVCGKCFQSISHKHKEIWKASNDDKIRINLIELSAAKDNLIKLVATKSDLNTRILNDKKILQRSKELDIDIKAYLVELESKRSLYQNYTLLIDEHVDVRDTKINELEKLKIELLNTKINDNNMLATASKIEALEREIISLLASETNLMQMLNALVGEQAIVSHRIKEASSNLEKIKLIKNDINTMERALIVNAKVIQAFGSKGIPSLITHSILDDLQEEANSWLSKLRQGLQLQFIVANSNKNNKEQDDTLDILYFIDGCEREYRQLSGAEKIIASLAIKLGILFIMNKRLGIDIRLILLDEVDQALDDGNTEIFSDMIKIIQSEFKVLVITHNGDALKHKFSHGIMIEKDDANVSRGKLIKW